MDKVRFSPKKEAVLSLLLAGKSQKAAAEEVGLNESTVCGWMKDPEFSGALASAQSDRLAEINRYLLEVAKKAIKNLEEILDNPDSKDYVRSQTANIVLTKLLDVSELVDVDSRLADIERALGNAQDSETAAD